MFLDDDKYLSEFCKNERTNLFKAIAVFEPFVGELENLPDGF